MFIVVASQRRSAPTLGRRRLRRGEDTSMGITRYFNPEYIGVLERTRGTETSKYPEERKSIETPSVAASERGPAEPGRVTGSVWKGAPQRVTAPYRKLHRTY